MSFNLLDKNGFTMAVSSLWSKTKAIIPTKVSQLQNDSGFKTTDTTYNVVSKTANGLAPQLPNETTTTKFLRQDGTWAEPQSGSSSNEIFNIKPAATHNGIFRGKDLTNVYTIDEICRRISNGTFEDLYIGDYFDITITSNYGTETVRCIIAGFNMYWKVGDAKILGNHAVIVTKNCLNTAHAMNATNTTKNGFLGTEMRNFLFPNYNTAFTNSLGSHIKTHRTLMTNAVDENINSNAGANETGASVGWQWYDTKITLLSEIQIYGCNVFSSSYYDTGCDNLQLPLFSLDPTAKVCKFGGTDDAGSSRQFYWLRNVASASDFAAVDSYGYSCHSAASISCGVRPIFCIG